MKIKVNIPTSLADITLSQYKKFLKIQTNNDDERFLQAKMIEIFCNIPLKDVMQLKYNDTNEISSILTNMFEEKPNLVQRFKVNGVEYGFHPNMDDLSLGEYIENKFQEKYSIQEYKVDDFTNALNIPMSAVLSSVFFLWNLGLDLSQTMMSYLENEQNLDLTEYLTSQLSGDGINQYLDSLKEILQDLNISQN